MDDVLRLYRYNRWATEALLDALSELPGEELGRNRGSSFPSMLDTLLHLYGAERTWLERWKGTSPDAFPDSSGVTSVPEARALWEGLWAEQAAYLANLTDAAVEGPLSYENFSGKANEQRLGDLLRHVVNHATYHRGQLATMLRQAGRVPPSTDYIRYLRQVEP